MSFPERLLIFDFSRRTSRRLARRSLSPSRILKASKAERVANELELKIFIPSLTVAVCLFHRLDCLVQFKYPQTQEPVWNVNSKFCQSLSWFQLPLYNLDWIHPAYLLFTKRSHVSPFTWDRAEVRPPWIYPCSIASKRESLS